MIIKTLDKISRRNLKLIPQNTVKCAFIDENDSRNAIWDMYVTSEGRCFFSVCAELYVCRSAGLYEYTYETNEIKCCFELDQKVCYCKDAIMPSKIHTSIRFLGRTHFNIESGLYLSCELSSIAVNEDGTRLAIGSNEKMGIAYELEL